MESSVPSELVCSIEGTLYLVVTTICCTLEALAATNASLSADRLIAFTLSARVHSTTHTVKWVCWPVHIYIWTGSSTSLSDWGMTFHSLIGCHLWFSSMHKSCSKYFCFRRPPSPETSVLQDSLHTVPSHFQPENCYWLWLIHYGLGCEYWSKCEPCYITESRSRFSAVCVIKGLTIDYMTSWLSESFSGSWL